MTTSTASILRTLSVAAFAACVLILSVRGIPGNPTSHELNNPQWKEDGPLELSPDRGRFALLYSFVEDRSLSFSLDIARFATPDLAQDARGRYVSLFAPGVSFLVLPGYYIGKLFHISQVGTFAEIALFAIANMLLLRLLALHLGAKQSAATLAGLIFLFATPAFAYAVTLYQHHVTLFLLLLSLYLLLRFRSWVSLCGIWTLCALSLSVDYPNAFLFAPLALAACARFIDLSSTTRGYTLRLHPLRVLTLGAALLPFLFFVWFNTASYGNPLQLAGTLPSVQAIDDAGHPTTPALQKDLNPLLASPDTTTEKTAVGFFETRNMLHGLYEHIVSQDRGILWFTPIILFGIPGLFFLYRREPYATALFVSLCGVNILLYSMWGDPYGGWAFGSRYLIPMYAMLCIGLAEFFSVLATNRQRVVLFLLCILFSYAVWVNALGALTSNRNPPQEEVLALERLSGKEQKYTYARNLDMLRRNVSKSFVFQTVGKRYIHATTYHALVWGSISFVGALYFIILLRERKGKHLRI